MIIEKFITSFKVTTSDYKLSHSLTLFCIVDNSRFVFRKSIIINNMYVGYKNETYNRDLAEHQLLRWLYTHLFFYKEANKLEKLLLAFKPETMTQGAIIKTLFKKTYIMRLI